MNGLELEVAAAIAVGLFVVFLVLQPLLAPDAETMQPDSPFDDLIDPEETPEGTAVAALREIEFDRATGKLSDEDYAFLKAKYTGLAIQALRTADAGGNETPASPPSPAPVEPTAARAAVERLVALRAGQLRGSSVPVCVQCGPRPEGDADYCSSCGAAIGTTACTGCGAPHRAGAKFCESCGVACVAA